MSEFDVYSRDDLISEIKSMRLKFKQAVTDEVIKQTEVERKDLNEKINKFVDATKDYVKKELDDILKLYDEAKERSYKDSFGWIGISHNFYSAKYTLEQFISWYPAPKPDVTEESAKEFVKEIDRRTIIGSLIKIFTGK